MAKCGDCEMNLSNISNLRSHIKRKHPGRLDHLAPKIRNSSASRSNVHVCNECTKTFIKFGSLRRHVRQQHSDKLDELAPIKVKNYKCLKCNVEFQLLQDFIQHKSSHTRPTTIQCPLCKYKGTSTDTLIEHYKFKHSLEINTETLEFESFEAFEHWKSIIEKETFASFIKTRVRKNSNHIKIYYRCHRSGEYKSRGKNLRQLKTQGSKKIGGFCPAKISVIVKDNKKCIVSFCQNHVGHQQENDLRHLFLTKAERENIAAKIAGKIPLQTILNEIRDSISNCHLERLHLLTRKDLYNIEAAFKLSGTSVRHPNDTISVDTWVNELKLSNSVLYYKRQDSLCAEFSHLKSDDFVLIIMTDGQRELAINFSQDCICVDGTHGLNGYGFELHTMLVLDDLCEGYPCAFLISSRGDTEIFKIFFSTIENALQIKIKPRVFMSDMAEAYYNAWLDVMYPAEYRLFCSWHVDKAWRKNLDKIRNDVERKAFIYRMLRMLLEERDINAFESLLPKFLIYCRENPNTIEFGKYFEDQYARKPERWAYCFRVNSGINTNMHIERMLRTIKHLYLDGKFVKRLDKAIAAIMKFVRDKLFERIIVLHKGKVSTKISDLRKRHKTSESLDVSKVVVTDEMSWIVPSSSSKELYVIEAVKSICDCKIVCNECNACIHRYSCTCMDSCIRWSMCKHIHLVSRYIQNLPKADQDIEVEFEGNLVVDIGNCENEVAALVKSLSTDMPPVQSDDPQQKILLQQQQLLETFKEELFASKSQDEIDVFKRIIAPLKPSLVAVRNQQNRIFTPTTLSTVPSNKNIEPQRRLFATKKLTKKRRPLQKFSAEESDILAVQLLHNGREN